MTHPLAGVGCIICGSNDVIASITVENNGIRGHYPTCRPHVEMAARRVIGDLQRMESDLPSDVVINVHDADLVHHQRVETFNDPQRNRPHPS